MFDARNTEFGQASTAAPAGLANLPADRVDDPRPVLIVLHQRHSVPGHIGQTLQALGHRLDIRRPRFGDPLPQSLDAFDGSVIFGGPMSANDPDDYVNQETDWIGVALKEQAPFLGVCLGAQMMAKHLGATVSEHPQAHVEIGYHDVSPIEPAFHGIAWPTRVYQWHREGFEIPHGGELLVNGPDAFPNQAYRYGSTAVGIQFHPEITYAMVSRWSGHNPHKLNQTGAQDRAGQLAAHIAHSPQVRRWLMQFLAAWVLEGRRVRALA